MKKTLLYLAAALAACCSCNKENAPISDGTLTFTATVAQTKVAIDVTGSKGTTSWEVGDVITVTDAAGVSASATLTAGDIDAGSATFTVSGLGAGPYRAFTGSATKSGEDLVFQPEAGKTWLGVAQTSSSSFAFKNVFNLIGFKAGADASSATLTAGTNCVISAGTALTLNYETGELSTAANAKTLSVPVVAGEVNFIPVVPGSTLEGFSVKTYDSASAEVGSATTTKTLDFSTRNQLAYIGEVKASAPSTPAATFTTTNSAVECAFGRTITVNFTAAAAWTATVKESGNGTVATTSGAAGAASTALTLNANTGSKRRNVTVVISADGYADAELAFTQERKADYEVIFLVYPNTYSKDSKYRTWTNANTLFTVKVATVFGTYTLTDGGITLVTGGYPSTATGSFQYDNSGFLFGNNGSQPDYTNRGGYITFPAIEGKKLVKVEAFGGAVTTNQLLKAKIATDNVGTSIVKGGEQQINEMNSKAALKNVTTSVVNSIQEEMTNDFGSYLCWTLEDTAVNTPYTMMVAARTVIRWFTLYYE